MLRFATSLSQEIIDELMMLSDHHRATSKSVIDKVARNPEMGVSLLDVLQAGLAARNLPEIGLEQFLKTLSKRQIIELWLGRGDNAATWGMSVRDGFKYLLDYATEHYDSNDVEYLMEKPLGVYLRAIMKIDPNGMISK
jgi:hypothetical protein